MKAVVFTIDAIFSLIITAVAITILLYFAYTPQTPLLISYSRTQSQLNTMLSLNVAQAANGSLIAREILNQYKGRSLNWAQAYGNPSNNASSAYGPLSPSVAFVAPLPGSASAPPVAAYGNIYAAAGSRILAINASSGAVAWNSSVGTVPQSVAVYNNLVMYWNSTPYFSSLYATSGKAAWSYLRGYLPTSQLLVYGNYGMFGTSSNTLNIYNLGNGSIQNGYISTNSLSFEPTSLAVANGTLAARSSGEGLGLISLVTTGQSAGQQIWYDAPGNPVTTNITVMGDLIAYGSGAKECATYSNGTQAFCYAPGKGTVTGVTSSSGEFFYQTVNSIVALSPAGSQLWSATFPYTATHQIPVSSAKMVYAGWNNGGLVAVNISTGKTAWSTVSNYGPISSMMLAYGRLYAVSGSNIIAFGACSSGAQSPIMSVAASLYANGDGACASALMNSLSPLSGYGLALNNTLRAGQSLPYFNGNAYLLDNSTNLPGGAQLTITAWVNPSSIQPSGCTTLCGVVSYGNRTCVGFSRALALDNVGNSIMYTSMSTSCNDYIPNPGPVVNDNQWNFVAMALNGSSVTLYANGQSSSGNLSVAPGTPISEDLAIGSLGYPGNLLNGSIADVQVYKTPLASNQIAQLYAEGLAGGPLQNSGLVSWWPLDGDTNDYGGYNNTVYPSNVVYKYSGYTPEGLKNSVSVSKATAVLPVQSYAAQFNGSSYISTGTKGFPVGSAARSVFAWIYFSGNSTGSIPYGSVIQEYGSSAAVSEASEMLVYRGNIGFAGGADTFISTMAVPLNRWSFVGYSYSAGSTSVTVYLNGQSQTGALNGGVPLNTVIQDSNIGREGSQVQSGYFNGSIADVQLYNASISSSQASAMYRQGLEGLPASNFGLVAWWPLNGNANDYSGNGNSGVPHNSVNYTSSINLYNAGILSWK